MTRKLLRAETIAVLVSGIILTVLLLVKPFVGLADNGDFQRIMGTVGLTYSDPALTHDDKFFQYVVPQFQWTALGLGSYVSTEVPLVFLASALNQLLLPGGLFDIRMMGALYGVLFLAAVYWLVKANKSAQAASGWLLAALLVFMFADVGYTSYFNSLFGEPVSFVFLLLTAGFATAIVRSEQPSRRLLAAFFVSALFLIGAKVQNAPVGIVLTLLCLRFRGLRSDFPWRRMTLSFAVVLLLASAAIYASVPIEIKRINQYQTVFYGILKGAPDPAGDLRALGLPEKYTVNAGSNYFDPAPISQQDRMLDEDFYPHISHGKVLAYYLRHPSRFVEKLEAAARDGMTIRPYYLGNYDKSAGKPPGAITSSFSIWSEWKRTWLPNKLWFIAGVYAMYYCVLAVRYLRAAKPRERIYVELFAALGCMGLIQFLVPVVGDGEADLAKHLFGFNVCFDLMLLASLVWLADQGYRLLAGGRSGKRLGY